MALVPVDVWSRIAYYLPPDPIDYVQCALVSKSAKDAFMSDHLWRAFTPVHETSDLAHKFAQRLRNLSTKNVKEITRRWLEYRRTGPVYLTPAFRSRTLDWPNEPLDLILPIIIRDYKLQYSPQGAALIRNNYHFALAIALSSECLADSCLLPYGTNHHFLQTAFRSARRIYPFKPSNLSDSLMIWYLSLSHNRNFDFVSDKLLLDYNAYRANPELLCRAPHHIKTDKHFILELMNENPSVLRYAPPELRSDMDLALAWIPGKLPYIINGVVHQDLLSNKEYALRHFKNAATLYPTETYLQTNLDDPHDDILSGSANMPRMYRRQIWEWRTAAQRDYLSEFSHHLRSDKEVIIAAVTANGEALKWASHQLRNDREVVIVAITANPLALQWASQDLRNDKEIVIAAVTANAAALYWATPECRNDREIVIAAIAAHARALNNPPNLDKFDQQHAYSLTVQAFESLSQTLIDDKLLLSMALPVSKMFQDTMFRRSNCRDDKDFVLQQVTSTPFILKSASARLRADPDVVTAAVKKDGRALQYASYKLKKDRELLLHAVISDPQAFRYVSEELLADTALVKAAIERQPNLVVPAPHRRICPLSLF